jgi:ribonuclease HI
MVSLYEHQLRQKANQFIDQIYSAHGYQAKLDANSFSDYGVDIKFESAGIAKLYYSPKRDYFTLTTSKLDKSHLPTILGFWDNMLALEAKPSVLKESRTNYQAFVDGSFDVVRQAVGYGAVILKEGVEITTLSGFVSKYIEERQIGGELSATMRVISWCKSNKVADIDIFYDYEGIEMWAIGRWKLKKPMAEEYSKYVKESGIKIYWHKVDSHTGVHWNEVADKLAKQGADKAEVRESLLEATAKAFIAHLNEQGFEAEFDGMKNNLFARINILVNKRVVGIFDLSNNKKRPLEAHIHSFDDNNLASEIEALWIVYKMKL